MHAADLDGRKQLDTKRARLEPEAQRKGAQQQAAQQPHINGVGDGAHTQDFFLNLWRNQGMRALVCSTNHVKSGSRQLSNKRNIHWSPLHSHAR